MNKQKLFILAFILTAAIISTGQPVFAAEEGIPSEESQELFLGVIKAFNWAIGFAALLSAVVFAIGTVEFMFFNRASEGKDKMFGSAIGLFLCLSSFVILTTINPKLVEPLNIIALPSVGGVYLVKADGSRAPTSYNFTVTDALSEYDHLTYDCEGLNPDVTPRMLVSLHLENSGSVLQVGCDESIPLASGGTKYSIRFEYPGVYLYTTTTCGGQETSYSDSYSGYAGPYKGNVNNFNLPQQFETTLVQCIMFVTGNGPDKHWLFIPQRVPDLVQKNNAIQPSVSCQTYYSNKDGIKTAIPVKQCPEMRSALIYRIPDNPIISGNKVGFFSEESGWNTGQNSKQLYIEPEEIGTGITLDPALMDFENIDENNPCKTFKDCHKSIQVIGNYIITLSSEGGKTKGYQADWQRHFITNVNDLAQQNVFKSDFPNFYKVSITPIIK